MRRQIWPGQTRIHAWTVLLHIMRPSLQTRMAKETSMAEVADEGEQLGTMAAYIVDGPEEGQPMPAGI